jgi:pimeloyl-ACP methyl ester carboxylesterase
MALTSFLFVHGSNHGSWSWELLRPHLAIGFTSVDLPGRGYFARDPAEVRLEDWVDHVCRSIEGPDLEDVVLVGHSLAGITLPRVVDRLASRLRHVVYIACAVPPQGCSVAEFLLDGAALPPSIPAPDPEAAREWFCNDMDERQTRFVLENLGPEAGQPFSVPMDLTGLSQPVPRTYIRLLQDRSPVGPRQEEIITRLDPIDVVEIDAGHDAMISAPAQIGAILNRCARSTAPIG